MHVYRVEVTFFHSNRRDGLFFSLVLLCCAVLLVPYLSVTTSGGQSTQIKYLSKSTDTYNKILLQ